MLRAYIDESGPENKGWMFLAGYMGSEDQWAKFEDQWRFELGPRKQSLHMTDLYWNKDRTRRLLQRLGPIPEACGLTPIASGVRYGDYEDLIRGTPAERLFKGWLACLFPLVLQTLRAVPEHERLELVFEEQKECQAHANTALSCELSIPNHPWKRTTDGKPKLCKWDFVPKGYTIRTDPADYLAFALREVWTNKNSRKSDWCRPILKTGAGIGKIYKRQEIRAAISSTILIAALRDATDM
jgi:hypothetical protein